MSELQHHLAVCAPMQGRLVPLKEVPDAAFAAGLVGAGVAIDPVGEWVVAPCDGVLRRSQHAHAFSIETAAGEVLVHVGIDTVRLAGEGIRVLREDGARVAMGDLILQLDLDRLALSAPSLVSPVLAMNVAAPLLRDLHAAGNVRCGEVLYRVPLRAGVAMPSSTAAVITRAARVRGEHGLHARPAAALVQALRGLNAEVWVQLRGKRADARSVTALMSLAAAGGEEVLLEASGVDAAQALEALSACFDPPATMQAVRSEPLPAQLTAQVAVRGVVAGPACRLLPPPRVLPPAASPDEEQRALEAALAAVSGRVAAQAASLAGARREVLDAHAMMLADPQLRSSALANVLRGLSAAAAWAQACEVIANDLRAAADRRMAERAADLADIAERVLDHLLGPRPAMSVPAGAVVITDELLPSQVAALEQSQVAAVVTARGGATAHAAILAAGLGLPMLVAAGEAVLDVADDTWMIVDAEAGVIELQPSAERLAEFASQRAQHEHRRLAAARAAQEPALLRSGEAVTVECNLGRAGDAGTAASSGAAGVGLLRTEFLFLEQTAAPDVAQQQAAYTAVTEAFAGRPVTIRLLDAGSDKPLPFIRLPQEDNPALGLRGLRTGLAHPQLLKDQLAAIAATPGNVRVLLPMVNDLAELRTVRTLLQRFERPLPLGIMIETPASVMLAESLAEEADFFSIGSNDLAQYVLGIDRLHPTLGAALDGLHPAVLRAMQAATRAAQRAQRPVAVCGGLGADPEAIPLLIGMGIRELSVAVAAVAQVKAAVRTLDAAACTELLQDALRAPDAVAVRALVRAFQARLERVRS